jgi:hypothetical protein
LERIFGNPRRPRYRHRLSFRGAASCAILSLGVRTLTISIGLAVSVLVLAAILITAAASSLLWWRTAEATSQQLASTINEQIVAAVRKEVSAIVEEAQAAHTAIRTLFLQNVLGTREADKREFVFLSQLQSQATISWVAFCWPDGAFFAQNDSLFIQWPHARFEDCLWRKADIRISDASGNASSRAHIGDAPPDKDDPSGYGPAAVTQRVS